MDYMGALERCRQAVFEMRGATPSAYDRSERVRVRERDKGCLL